MLPIAEVRISVIGYVNCAIQCRKAWWQFENFECLNVKPYRPYFYSRNQQCTNISESETISSAHCILSNCLCFCIFFFFRLRWLPLHAFWCDPSHALIQTNSIVPHGHDQLTTSRMDPQELLYATSIYSCRWWSNHCSIEFRVSAYYVSRIADLEKDVQKLRNEKNMLVQKFEEASRGPVLFLLRNMLEIFFVLIIVRSTSALPFLSHVI